jgi:hypothetical protein
MSILSARPAKRALVALAALAAPVALVATAAAPASASASDECEYVDGIPVCYPSPQPDDGDLAVSSTAATESDGFGVGSRLDGWANRDLDIGSLAFAAAARERMGR